MSAPFSNLPADKRLAVIEELERREDGAMRRAVRGAWIALVAVGLVLAILLFGVSWASVRLRDTRRQVASLTQQRSALDDATERQRTKLASLDKEIREKQQALAALIGAVRTDPSALSGVGKALDQNPRAVTLVPRAYVQILDDMDRQWARNLSDRLQNAGVIPVGVEFVPNSAPLRQFQVRYYKKSEEDGARRIVSIMQDAGVSAELVYLNLEDNKRVRDNHFEIWCPANARASKLRPIAPA